jgi:hypothetical protein
MGSENDEDDEAVETADSRDRSRGFVRICGPSNRPCHMNWKATTIPRPIQTTGALTSATIEAGDEEPPPRERRWCTRGKYPNLRRYSCWAAKDSRDTPRSI